MCNQHLEGSLLRKASEIKLYFQGMLGVKTRGKGGKGELRRKGGDVPCFVGFTIIRGLEAEAGVPRRASHGS